MTENKFDVVEYLESLNLRCCKVVVRGLDWVVLNNEPFVSRPSGYAWEGDLPFVEASLELQNYIIAEHNAALKKHREEWNLPA
jgi:predicted RNA methylase